MRRDWFPEPGELLKEDEISLSNQTHCPFCLTGNLGSKVGPLRNCHVCATDVTRKHRKAGSKRADGIETARIEHTRQRLGSEQELKHVPADGPNSGISGVPREVIEERNLQEENISLPLPLSTGHSFLTSVSAQQNFFADDISSPHFLQATHVDAAKPVRIPQRDKPLSIYDEFMGNCPVVQPRNNRVQTSNPSLFFADPAQQSHHVYRGQDQEPPNIACTPYISNHVKTYHVQVRSEEGRVPDGSSGGTLDNNMHPLLRPDFNFGKSPLHTFTLRPDLTRQTLSAQDKAAMPRLPPRLPPRPSALASTSASAHTLPHTSFRSPDTAPSPRVSWAPQLQRQHLSAAEKADVHPRPMARYCSRPAYQVATFRSLPHIQIHASSEVRKVVHRGNEGGD